MSSSIIIKVFLGLVKLIVRNDTQQHLMSIVLSLERNCVASTLFYLWFSGRLSDSR